MHNNSVGRHTLSKTGGVEYREGASIYVRGYGILKLLAGKEYINVSLI